MPTEKKSTEHSTLGAALSPQMRQQLEALQKALKQQVQKTVLMQTTRPPEPWRTLPIPKFTVPKADPRRKGAAGFQRPPTVTAPPRRLPKSSSVAPLSGAASQPSPARQTPAPSFTWWTLPPEAAVRETPPKFASFNDRAQLSRALERGEADFDGVLDGLPLFVTIGLDFGTSCTKIIVRLEDPGSPTIAIPAPGHCRSQAKPYLWQTAVWALPNGTFLPWPDPAAQLLHTLKQGIIGSDPNSYVAPQATRLDAATAYLAFVIRYVRGWLLLNATQRFANRRIAWFVNLGLPAASLDDKKQSATYRRVGCAAIVVAGTPGPITSQKTQASLFAPAIERASSSAEKAEAIGVSIVPEVAAAVTGFTRSAATADGLYFLVDVGAMTLDACTFRFRRGNTGDKYPLYRAEVRPLGVESYHWFVGSGKFPEGFKDQCDRLLRQVVWDTKTKPKGDPSAEAWRPGNSLPVFLVGGGASNLVHKDAVSALAPWLRQHARNDGISFISLDLPQNLEVSEPLDDFSRVAVAWGLSFPPREIGEIKLPSAIEDIPQAAPSDYSQHFVSKDQT